MKVGWKHRNGEELNWFKPSESKKIKFSRAQVYTFKEVLTSAKDIFRDIHSNHFLDNSYSSLSLSNGTIIDSFPHDNLWECKKIFDSSGRFLSLYLLTTHSKIDHSDSVTPKAGSSVNKFEKNDNHVLEASQKKKNVEVVETCKSVLNPKEEELHSSEVYLNCPPMDFGMDSKYKTNNPNYSNSTSRAEQGSMNFSFKQPEILKKSSEVNSSVPASYMELAPPPTKKNKVSITDVNDLRVPLTGLLPKESIQFLKKDLGEGGQGSVTKGKLNGTTIAIKTMQSFSFNVQQIIKEIAALRLAAHENVVTFLGVCIDRPITVHLLLEFVDGYNLKEVLLDSTLKELFLKTELQKHQVCYQTTKAVAYLHGHPYNFKHRDSKPLNILINRKTKVIKLCDFGFAQMNVHFSKLESTNGKPRKVGTYWYMAPEIFFKKELYSKASDVWSLCATLCEVYLETPIWDRCESIECILENKTVPKLDGCPGLLLPVLQSGFSYISRERPTAMNILDKYSFLDDE